MDLWVSDVDGVLTNLLAEPNKEVLRLTAKLGVKQPFCYVTGRAAQWLEDNIVPALDKEFKIHAPYFSILGAECGSITLQYDGKKSWQREYASDLTPLEPDIRGKLQREIDRIAGVKFDYEKEIMISVEADHALRKSEPDVVDKGLEEANQIFKKVADQHSHIDFLKTTYAYDLVPKGLNKAYGMRMLLKQIDFTPAHIHILGDSLSDLLFADPLIEVAIPYTMHFVGDEKKLTDEQRKRYALNITKRRYDEGAREVLEEALTT